MSPHIIITYIQNRENFFKKQIPRPEIKTNHASIEKLESKIVHVYEYHCKKCGGEVAISNEFCLSCGTRLKKENVLIKEVEEKKKEKKPEGYYKEILLKFFYLICCVIIGSCSGIIGSGTINGWYYFLISLFLWIGAGKILYTYQFNINKNKYGLIALFFFIIFIFGLIN